MRDIGGVEKLLTSYLLLALALAIGGSLGIGIAIRAVIGWLVVLLVGSALRWCIRWPDLQSLVPSLDVQQLAYLAGGDRRVHQLLLAQLVQKEHLLVDDQLELWIGRKPSQALSPLEEQMLARVHSRGPDARIRPDLRRFNMGILKKKLRERRLILSRSAAILSGCGSLNLLFFAILPAIPLLLVFIMAMVFFGLLPEAATLGFMEVVNRGYGDFCLLWFWSAWFGVVVDARSERTRWGDKVLLHHQDNHDPSDPMVITALFGTMQPGHLASMLGRWEESSNVSDSGG